MGPIESHKSLIECLNSQAYWNCHNDYSLHVPCFDYCWTISNMQIVLMSIPWDMSRVQDINVVRDILIKTKQKGFVCCTKHNQLWRTLH